MDGRKMYKGIKRLMTGWMHKRIKDRLIYEWMGG